MQDWDSRIKILKTNIQNAREKFVISNLKLKEKSVSAPIESPKNTDSIVVNEKKEDNPSENKIYENKDPLSSIELLNKEDNVIDNKIKIDTKLGLTEEITNKIDVTLEKEAKSEISIESPKVDVSEAIEAQEASKEEPKIEISSDKESDNSDEVVVKKTELELLEEKNENDLTEDEEDRMYELRRLRAQKAMNNEANQVIQDGLKKADEEIAHLKSQLKPKEKKLPKGFVS